MGKHDLTIFRYSTILTLTRNGISTIAELEAMTRRAYRGDTGCAQGARRGRHNDGNMEVGK